MPKLQGCVDRQWRARYHHVCTISLASSTHVPKRHDDPRAFGNVIGAVTKGRDGHRFINHSEVLCCTGRSAVREVTWLVAMPNSKLLLHWIVQLWRLKGHTTRAWNVETQIKDAKIPDISSTICLNNGCRGPEEDSIDAISQDKDNGKDRSTSMQPMWLHFLKKRPAEEGVLRDCVFPSRHAATKLRTTARSTSLSQPCVTSNDSCNSVGSGWKPLDLSLQRSGKKQAASNLTIFLTVILFLAISTVRICQLPSACHLPKPRRHRCGMWWYLSHEVMEVSSPWLGESCGNSYSNSGWSESTLKCM